MTPLAVATNGHLGNSTLSVVTVGFIGTSGNTGGFVFPVFIDNSRAQDEEIVISVILAAMQAGLFNE